MSGKLGIDAAWSRMRTTSNSGQWRNLHSFACACIHTRADRMIHFQVAARNLIDIANKTLRGEFARFIVYSYSWFGFPVWITDSAGAVNNSGWRDVVFKWRWINYRRRRWGTERCRQAPRHVGHIFPFNSTSQLFQNEPIYLLMNPPKRWQIHHILKKW